MPYFRCEIHRLIVPSGVVSHEVELIFPRGLTLSGMVLSDRRRHRDETVRLRSVDPALQVNLTASVEDGAFRFGALPEGRYELRAHPGDFDQVQVASEPILVSAGTSGITLKLRQEAKISGFVVGGTGRSFLVCDPPLNRTSPYCEEVEEPTREDGAFELGSLRPGIRRVIARQFPNLIGISEAVELKEGETRSSLRINLTVGAAVLIEHELGPQRATCQVTTAGVTWKEELRGQSKSTRVIVPAGHVKFSVEHPTLDSPLRRELGLIAGEERTVRIDKKP